jgi:TolA-binding protein
MNTKKIVWFAIFILVFIPTCHRTTNNMMLQQKRKSQTTLLQLLQKIDSLSNFGDDFHLVYKDYIAEAEEFGEEYPEDPMSAEFLYKAGVLAMKIAEAAEDNAEKLLYCQKALLIMDEILLIYPDFYEVKNCVLYKGVIYDYLLMDYENAEIYYREFIARYPTDTLAVNVESYLPYLGKSPEETFGQFGK